MATKKSSVERELIAGLEEILDHKRGKRRLVGHRRELAKPMHTTELLHRQRDKILRIAAAHGALDVRIFGSVAGGDDHADSDVDLLVRPGPTTSPWFPVGLIEDLETLLGRKVDVITEDALHWTIRDKVLREATPL